MTSQVPPIPPAWNEAMQNSPSFLHDWLSGWFVHHPDGGFGFSDKGAANLASLGFLFFLAGRFSGAAILRKYSACKTLGLYGACNVVLCILIFLKLGWVSVASVFLSYFFMSIMYPTIFALGIDGLGAKTKQASSFIVMAIIGGAILPKAMGDIADHYDLSRGYILPMVCFLFIAVYGFVWPWLRSESLTEESIDLHPSSIPKKA
jgi:FHS family L-fucose permease-like MFS transporter